MKDYSDLQWKPWLTACIREYYNTGNIRIPDDCVGSDILLALEYFGILTSSPNTFIFDSAQALGRIKVWSAYFSHRNAIAEWVLSDFRHCLGSSRIWITTSNPDEGDHAETLLQVDGGTAAILGGENDRRATTEDLPSSTVIHYLFFDNESTNLISQETPMRMRRDFCEHLRRQLHCGTANVSFDIERVKITKSTGRITTALRAVLRLQVSRQERVSLQALETNSIAESNGAKNRSRRRNDANNSIVEESFGSEDSELARIVQVGSSESNEGYDEQNMSLGRSEATPPAAGVDEQRHPYRSTPPPEGRRTEPEHKKSSRNASKSKEQIIGDQESLQHIDHSAPIGYVNTDFGDLQSVTSALSDPYMDESTVNSMSSRFLVQLARKRLMPTSERNQNPVYGRTEDPSVAELDEEPPQPPEPPKNRFQANSAFKEPEKVPEKCTAMADDPNEKEGIECNFWEGIIGNMCGGAVPMAQNTEDLTGRNESGPEYDFFSKVIKSASMDGQAAKRWLESTFIEDASYVPDGVVEKSTEPTSRSRADQNDGFVATERADHTRPGSKVQDDDRPESIPLGFRSRSSPSYDREARLAPDTAPRDDESSASIDMMPPRRKQNTSHRFADTPDSDIIALKNRRRSEIHRAKTSALAMHTARSLRNSEAHVDVDLPPREPRRARVREPIARKKHYSSATPPPYSDDVLIRGQTPGRSTTSKAKVRPSGSSRLFRKGSSGTIESLPGARSSKGRKMLL